MWRKWKLHKHAVNTTVSIQFIYFTEYFAFFDICREFTPEVYNAGLFTCTPFKLDVSCRITARANKNDSQPWCDVAFNFKPLYFNLVITRMAAI